MKKIKNSQKGLTFLELIIVMAIFSVLGVTLIFNFTNFSTSISLQNLAQDVALQFRSAQSSAVNGRSPVLIDDSQISPYDITDGDPLWTPSYGLFFKTSDDDRFKYFFDRESNLEEGDQFYQAKNLMNDDSSCGFDLSECLDEIQITTGDVVDRLCINEISSGVICEEGEGVNNLHVTYKRPSPQAIIRTMPDSQDTISDATIYLKSAKGKYRRVIVSVTGQISVQQYETP
jgi:prepilin-type N-terminal cleavage/methylation domain-containing protein